MTVSVYLSIVKRARFTECYNIKCVISQDQEITSDKLRDNLIMDESF